MCVCIFNVHVPGDPKGKDVLGKVKKDAGKNKMLHTARSSSSAGKNCSCNYRISNYYIIQLLILYQSPSSHFYICHYAFVPGKRRSIKSPGQTAA